VHLWRMLSAISACGTAVSQRAYEGMTRYTIFAPYHHGTIDGERPCTGLQQFGRTNASFINKALASELEARQVHRGTARRSLRYEHTYELLFLTCCTPRRNAVGVLPNSNHGKTANFIGSCYETTNKLRTSSQVQVGFQKLM
jgi:hypothetical protein